MKDAVGLLCCALVASVALTAPACSLGTSGLGPGGSSGRDDGTPTTTIPSGSREDAGSSSSDADGSATSSLDSAGPADAADATPAPVSCDVDGDGFLSASPACGGNDCCDDDPLTAPGQTAFFQSPNGCGGFDYDCSGAAEPEVGVAMCKLNFLSCDGDGFAAPTACGSQGDFVSCSFAGVGCSESRKPRTQGCH